MKVTSDGSLHPCRWAFHGTADGHLSETTARDYFQKGMAGFRASFLDGNLPSSCLECQRMDQMGKVSGRAKQLLKTGVRIDEFVHTMVSSPWMDEFAYSQEHHGDTRVLPQDWQIDLGNTCNSACIFCSPKSSSRVASEYRRIGIEFEPVKKSWFDDQGNVDQFVAELKISPTIKYIHFIGGETLLTPSFKVILASLIESGLNEEVTLGLTTNLTVWDESINTMLTRFKNVNLGMSVECLHPLNDYIRFGSRFEQTIELLDRYVDLGKSLGWYLQLRTTPTIFSVWHLASIYEYAYINGLAVESCNFLTRPECFRLDGLPLELRQAAIYKLEKWVTEHPAVRSVEPGMTVVNIRNPAVHKNQIVEDAVSYVEYLKSVPVDQTYYPDLVDFLHRIERSRGNTITEYLPEYEDFLRSIGY
jgi:sulfatase maturation enzyme AslB (radical SAM superfamily)